MSRAPNTPQFSEYIETPRGCTAPVKIDVILEQRMKLFVQKRMRKIGLSD